MRYSIQNRNLIIENDKQITVTLPSEIGEVIDFDDYVIVRLKVVEGLKIRNNIYCVSSDGKILWQISSGQTVSNSPYTGISKENDGTLYACNWDGTDIWLDPKTGKILRKAFSK